MTFLFIADIMDDVASDRRFAPIGKCFTSGYQNKRENDSQELDFLNPLRQPCRPAKIY